MPILLKILPIMFLLSLLLSRRMLRMHTHNLCFCHWKFPLLLSYAFVDLDQVKTAPLYDLPTVMGKDNCNTRHCQRSKAKTTIATLMSGSMSTTTAHQIWKSSSMQSWYRKDSKEFRKTVYFVTTTVMYFYISFFILVFTVDSRQHFIDPKGSGFCFWCTPNRPGS